jgi:hypothetical protein
MALTRIKGSIFQKHENNLPVNVIDFGADPTGVSDSSAAIQAAIDYAGNVLNTGLTTTQQGSGVYLPGGKYRINSMLRLDPGVHDGVSIFGDGPQSSFLVTNQDITMLRIGGDHSLADSTGVASTYSSRIANFCMRDDGQADTIGIQIGRSPGHIIENMSFSGLKLSIDGQRWNYGYMNKCSFWGGRSTPHDAFIRLQGSYSSTNNWTPGGNLFWTDLNFQGSSNHEDAPISAIEVSSGDGLYINHAHTQFTKYGLRIRLRGTEDKNKDGISEVIAENCYFDNPKNNGSNVFIDGTFGTTPPPILQNLRFNNCLFRGDYYASYGLRHEAFPGDTSQNISNIEFNDCHFRQHKNIPLSLLGEASGRAKVDRLTVRGCTFEENGGQRDAEGAVIAAAHNHAVFSGEVRHFVFTNNTVDFPISAPSTYGINLFSTEAGATCQITDNNFQRLVDAGVTRNNLINANLTVAGRPKVIKDNLGYNFHAAGRANLTAGTATVTFTEGSFPSFEFAITLAGSVGTESFWWSGRSASGFTINSSNPASTAVVLWTAETHSQ